MRFHLLDLRGTLHLVEQQVTQSGCKEVIRCKTVRMKRLHFLQRWDISRPKGDIPAIHLIMASGFGGDFRVLFLDDRFGKASAENALKSCDP